MQRSLEFIQKISQTAVKAITSTVKKVKRVKSAFQWIGNTYEELVDPQTVLTRRDQQKQQAEEMKHVGSWSSEDREKDMKRVAQEKHRRQAKLQKKKNGYGCLDSDDEDSKFGTSLPQKAKSGKATDSLAFMEGDLVWEKDWQVEPVYMFMGEDSGKGYSPCG